MNFLRFAFALDLEMPATICPRPPYFSLISMCRPVSGILGLTLGDTRQLSQGQTDALNAKSPAVFTHDPASKMQSIASKRIHRIV